MSLFVTNLLLALAWVAVNGDFSLGGFVAGFILAHLILFLARPLYPGQRYFHTLWGALGFLLWFLKEVWVSSVRVAKGVLGIGPKPTPAVVAIPLDARTDLEITLLACCITLTPGTLSLDVSPDRRTLYIHSMFTEDVEALRRETKETMERRILEFLR
ncbi:Na+/H+ antiporter subunit E [Oleisolibacter albus]|uniref:Na+/H+ antiporter subunit E n=1 Tax=Oleisolibacter albus TaxID=2171757 RepID=UPI000DF33D4F|nr:Na+/H+ antiporter subunit E [Oleisolibacter albus]